MRLRKSSGAIWTATLLAAAISFAQQERGTISGTVVDATGAVVPSARVTVTNRDTNTAFTTVSGEAGQYTVPNLNPGIYNLRIEKEGFKVAITSGMAIDAGANVRQDISLEVGTATQAVEVQAEALTVQTDSARSQTVITDKLIRDLPTVVGGNLRSPFDLAILTPESKNFGDNNFQIGGGQAASFGVNLDGISANTTRALSNSWVATNTPSLEALTEFTVETNGFKAEYGGAGGGAINFISKSGTNEFHGVAYEYARNDAFDARGFFQAQKQVYKQHDFGATIGGPVWLPKIYNGRNKTFFFASYEGFRNRNGAVSDRRTAPTPEMLDGDFHNWVDASGKVLQIYDPFSLQNGVRDPFPGNVIPKARFDPQSVKAISAFSSGPGGQLKPNNAAALGTVGYVLNNYVTTTGSKIQPADKFSVKLDQNIRDKDRISFYYGYNRNLETPGPNGPPTLPGYYTDYNDLNQASNVYRFTWDHNFSATLLNHFRGGGNDWAQSHNSPQELIGNWKDKFCISNAPDCNYSLGEIKFTETYTKWGADSNNGSENNVYSFADDVTKIHGTHTIKFGGMYQHGQYNGFGRQCVAGCAEFSFIGTGPAGATNQSLGGNAFASFLLGWATNGQIDTVRYIGQNWPYYAGYVQDDWRITQRLTLNLGLRWETALPPYEEQDRWSDFSPVRPNPGADNRPGALIYAGTGNGREGSRTLADSWFKGFGPRIGLAYGINPKTVIRASFARSFSQVTTTTGSTHQKGFTQTTGFPNTSNGLSPSFLLKDGLPPYPVPPFISPSFQNGKDMPWWQNGEVSRLPEQLNWNLSIQRQLTNSLILDLGYNAVVGSHLQAGLLAYNQLPISVLQQYTKATLALNFNNAAQAAQLAALGFTVPYANFTKDFGNNATLAQALRPFPQYTDINTWDGNGDHSGHSNYQAALIKLEKRYASGLAFTSSYVLSKLLTDADSYWITDQSRAADQYNRRLEKSIGAYDVTHNFKVGLTYELPFGKGKRFLTSGVGAWALGGWRVASIHFYSSGRPIPISGGTGLNIFNGRSPAFITSYDNWQPSSWAHGSFDPAVDRFLNRAAFPDQNVLAIGNSTRFNPKLREFPNYNENLSVAKVFRWKERFSAELRGEAFNLLNRVRFGYGSTNVNASDLGTVTNTLNSPRQIQLGLKINY
jgi:outer membrane receptor protein involved in Fe transport